MKIKAVVFNHNQLATAEPLFNALGTVFDTALFDSGSEPLQHSHSTTHKFENLYWTGCWNKAWELFPDYDVIWGIGGDCSLINEPGSYKQALESAFPFGTWSPTVQGRAHDYMKPDVAKGNVFSVHFLEGMAFAMSRELRERLGEMDSENYIGYGQDLYCCYISRKNNLKNILDSRVSLSHPPSGQYDELEARELMITSMRRLLGEDWSDIIDWWWGRRISFKANSISRIDLKVDGKGYVRPFISD